MRPCDSCTVATPAARSVTYDTRKAAPAATAPPALERLKNCNFTRLAVTDTIPVGTRADALKDRLVVLSVAELIGDAIHRIHHNESVSALFKGDPGDRG